MHRILLKRNFSLKVFKDLLFKNHPNNYLPPASKLFHATAFIACKMESKEELRKRLTPLQYEVTQEAATERPYTGEYDKFFERGVYRCIVCHQDLFLSDEKFDSGCGWPAFKDTIDQGKVTLHKDASISYMVRTEVRCAKCDAHMGHVFDDGPLPKRTRFCINSASIEFISAEERNKGK